MTFILSWTDRDRGQLSISAEDRNSLKTVHDALLYTEEASDFGLEVVTTHKAGVFLTPDEEKKAKA